MRLIGAKVPRVEDRRILTGRGHYIDDLHLPHMLHATFLRDQEELAEDEAYRILKQNETLDEAEEWATFGEWAPMASSNVAGASYEHEEERLTIG